jgi:hypothetical protein
MASRTLQVNITGDPSSFKRAVRSMDDDVRRSEGRLKNFGKAGAAALGGIGIAAGVGAAVGLKKVADATIEAEKSQARMVTQLRAAGVSFKSHAAEIDRVIQKHSQLAGIDDEELQDAFTNIVRSSGSVDVGLRRVGLAADIARAKQMDVAKAGELVGKVADPCEGRDGVREPDRPEREASRPDPHRDRRYPRRVRQRGEGGPPVQ